MFKKSTTVLSAALGVAMLLPVVAMAADAPAAPASPHTVTGNVGLFSQYVFRGLTQTNGKPAIQGGFDYGHSSGFYAGTWLSNSNWFTEQTVTIAPPTSIGTSTITSTSGLEWDGYFGFKNAFANDWSYDVGFLHYDYPGSYAANLQAVTGFKKPNTNEVYGQLGWKWLTAKYSHSLGDTFGIPNASGSYYLDLSAAIPLGDSGVTLGLHAGKQKYKGTAPFFTTAGSRNTNDIFSYTDYKIGLSKDYAGFTWGVAATRTNAKATLVDAALGGTVAVYQNVFGKNIGGSQVILSVARTF